MSGWDPDGDRTCGFLPAVTTGPCGDFASRVSERQHVSDKLNIKHDLASVKQLIVNRVCITVTDVATHSPRHSRAGGTPRNYQVNLTGCSANAGVGLLWETIREDEPQRSQRNTEGRRGEGKIKWSERKKVCD